MIIELFHYRLDYISLFLLTVLDLLISSFLHIDRYYGPPSAELSEIDLKRKHWLQNLVLLGIMQIHIVAGLVIGGGEVDFRKKHKLR